MGGGDVGDNVFTDDLLLAYFCIGVLDVYRDYSHVYLMNILLYFHTGKHPFSYTQDGVCIDGKIYQVRLLSTMFESIVAII